MQKLLFISLVFFYGASCNKDNDGQDCKDCGDVFCTEIFKTIDIEVKNADNEAVILDSFHVILNGNRLNLDHSDVYREGTYPLVNDGHMKDLRCKGSDVKFVYFYQEKQGSETFSIGKDCCHVLQRGTKNLEILIP